MSDIDKLLEAMDLPALQAHRAKVDVMISEYVNKKRKAALDAARAAAAQFGVDLDDLLTSKPSTKSRTPRKPAAETAQTGAKLKAPPMYKHPENSGITWSGKGKPPNWIKDAKDRTPFMINT